jgi:hypothetical protein
MGDIDDILKKDRVKDIIDDTAADVDGIQAIIIAYTRKDGSLHWRSNCRRSEGLGIFDVVHHDLLFRNPDED